MPDLSCRSAESVENYALCGSLFYFRSYIISIEEGQLRVISAGALGIGLVIGWATGFMGWSRDGIGYRAAALAGVAVILARYGAAVLVLGLAGAALGAAVHDLLLEAIRRRGA